MTKKDYIHFSSTIRNTSNIPVPLINKGLKNTPEAVEVYKQELANFIGQICQRDNYRFDWDKWEDYIFNK